MQLYVVNDPNYEGNNGKLKVIIFGDKKQYDAFVKKVESQLMVANCFNGVKAVDCCMHMSEVPEVRNEGQPNEYVYKSKVIDKITFTKAEKAYDIAAITKESVDNFPFDATYYVSSTPDELKAFYDKYIKVSNDDIVDDEEVEVFDAPKKEVVAKTNAVEAAPSQNEAAKTNDIADDEANDLVEAINDAPMSAPAKDAPASAPTEDTSDAEVEDLLKDLDLD